MSGQKEETARAEAAQAGHQFRQAQAQVYAMEKSVADMRSQQDELK